MAVGLGYMLGLRLPQNFNSPYKATDIADFWRRWHISLSTILRDYLYIPMGGSRGATWKTYRNLLITMLLGGLWHGANWTFVFWGGYHGILLCANRVWSRQVESLPLALRRAGTFLLVVIGWVFFRSTSFGMAGDILNRMFSWHSGSPLIGASTLLALVLFSAAISHFGPNTWEIRYQWKPLPGAALAVLFFSALPLSTGAISRSFCIFSSERI